MARGDRHIDLVYLALRISHNLASCDRIAICLSGRVRTPVAFHCDESWYFGACLGAPHAAARETGCLSAKDQ